MLSYCAMHVQRSAFVFFLAALLVGGINNAAQAADHFIAPGKSLFDCNSEGVDPGDLIVMAAGARDEITFRNCVGTAANNIFITNDPNGTSPTRIQSSGSSKIFNCEDCEHVTIDGTGKWVGAPSGSCGVTANGSNGWVLGRTQCGIVIECVSGGGGQWYLRIDGSSTAMTVKGIEINGGYPGCDNRSPGTGISLNDHKYQNHPGEWREDFLFTQNYIHNTISEGLYLGPNQTSNQVDDLQLRNNEVSYNLIEDSGFEGLELKSTIEGSSSIHHNYVARSGRYQGDISGNGGHGIMVYESGYVEVYNNFVIDTLTAVGGGNCYGHFMQRMDTSRMATAPVTWYNNVAIDCKGRGINSGRNSGKPAPIPTIYNNTIINADTGINAGVSGFPCIVRNNIAAGTNKAYSISGCTTADNLSGSVASFNFLNSRNNDYHLTVTSPATDSGTASGAPPDDFNDVSRPQGDAFDIGAFEFDLGERIARPNPPSLEQIQ